jgi:hypothetical protein
VFEDSAVRVRVPDAERVYDNLEYKSDDTGDQARAREVDRLYDSLDYPVSFFSTLKEAVAILQDMQDPSSSKLFEKIDRISREDNLKWKRSACTQALTSIEKNSRKNQR